MSTTTALSPQNYNNSSSPTILRRSYNNQRTTTRCIPQIVILGFGMLIGFILSSMVFLTSSTTTIPSSSNSIPFDVSQESRALSATKLSQFNPSKGHHYHMNNDAAQTTITTTSTTEGWKQIHVFYGDTKHIYDSTELPTPYFKANVWFSQYRQDELVSELLHGKKGGFFIDLAANDPVRISNTYALETYFDWDGLCIEPNPTYWTGLSYRKCHVVAAIIGHQTMEEISFRYPRSKAPQGGIIGNEFDNKSDKWNEGHPRYTVSLIDVFTKFQVPTIIDYISLDVEGAEDLVMSSFPFHQYRFNIMTVERPTEVLTNLLTANGYILLKTVKKNVDTLWVHHTIMETIDKTALDTIDTENYKYRENIALPRIAPEQNSVSE